MGSKRIIASLALVACCVAPAGVRAQQFDREAAAAAADHAAAEAEKAAAAAESAMLAARQAAVAARAAANASRIALGLPAYAPPASVGSGASKSMVKEAGLPPAENIPVERPGQVAIAPDAAISRSEQQAFTSALSASVANGTNGSPLKSSKTPDLQVLASSTDKIASIAWSVDLSTQPRSNHLAADQFTLTASGKLDDNGEAQLLGLRGFPNGTEIKLAYTHYGSRILLNGVEKEQVRIAREKCLSQPGSDAKTCNPYDYASGVSVFVAKYNPAGLQPLLNEVLPGPVWYYGIEMAGNHVSYKYLNRSTFTIGKESQFGYGATAFGGILIGSGQTSIGGAFTYRRQYEEQDPVTLCQAVAATVQTQCITAPDGRPVMSTQAIISVDFRHAFATNVGQFASLAIAPEFSADIDNHAYSIDVPLYFASAADGKFRGGIRGVYLNERDEKNGGRKGSFALGLFVGVPFSLFAH
jgi:hypothetical protein